MTQEEKIDQLLPCVKLPLKRLLAIANIRGINLLVSETYRSWERQEQLYQSGRTTPGNIVTNAKPGMSWHQWRRAIDLAFDKGDGTFDFTSKNPWDQIGLIAEPLGFTWGGRWRMKDLGHVEMRGECSLWLRRAVHQGTVIQGTEGPMVEELQRRLTDAGFNPGRIDGDYGPHTQTAVDEAWIKLNPTAAFVPGKPPTIEVLELLEDFITHRQFGGPVERAR